MTPGDLVLGTAGHVDHGKTSLVRALTGVDLDSLPEEKERGITVALGFTRLVLPDGRSAAFVDVPGHERLVRTMIAGATGVDAVVLCVSAVDGVMPQTREHLAILDLLGVRQGVVALTMADLVDAELLALAAEELRELLAPTALRDAPIVPFSSVTTLGHDALLAALSALERPAVAASGPFRLPVDRVFVRTGFGTVVTGTVASGSLADGDSVTVLPSGVTARVRGVEVHGEAADRAVPGRRTALNLSGVAPDAVSRGDVVVVGDVPMTSIVDVWCRAIGPLADGDAVRLLAGTLERGGRVALLDDGDLGPGDEAWVQIRTDAPFPVLPGDRLILRRPSPAETLGGGVVVDPWAPRFRVRDRARRRAILDRLRGGDADAWLTAAGEPGLSVDEAGARGVQGGVSLGDRVVDPDAAAALDDALARVLAAWHAARPLARGVPRRELRRDRLGHLGDRAFDALLDRAVAQGAAVIDGPLVRAAAFAVTLDAAAAAVRDRVWAAIDGSGLEGRAEKDLAALDPDAGALVRLLEADGRVRDVPGLGWASTARLDDLEARVRMFLADRGELTPVDFKDLTGLTRKAAIPLLEHLDRRKVTRRTGDRRVRGD